MVCYKAYGDDDDGKGYKDIDDVFQLILCVCGYATFQNSHQTIALSTAV